MTPSQIIASLNSLRVGDLDVVRGKIDEARAACLDLEQSALAQLLDEAGSALVRADLKAFRKRVETVVARLGHLR